MNASINQIAQSNGDTSANEANRIRERERAVSEAWWRVAYHESEQACTPVRVANESGLPVDFVVRVCFVKGHTLA